MRKRISKEQFSPERRQQTRERRDDLQRELRGESPKPASERESAPRREFNDGEKRDFKPRGERGGDFVKREFSGDSRPPRREFNDGEKRDFKPRSERGGDFVKREFSGDSRPPRRDFDGPKKEYSPRGERGGDFVKREFSGDSRPPRRDFDGPKKEYSPRGERGGDFVKREFSGDSRPPRRDFDGPKKEYSPRGERGGDFVKREFSGDSRPPRRDFNDGEKRDFKPRGERGGDFVKREFSGDSRPPRRDFNDGEKRDFKPRGERGGDFVKREFSGDSRPPRRDFNDGEKGDFKPRGERGGDFVKREFSGDSRPPRREFNDGAKGDFKPRGERSGSDARPPRFDAEKKSFSPRGERADTERRAKAPGKTLGSAKGNFGGTNLFKAHSPIETSEKWTPNYQLEKLKDGVNPKVRREIEKAAKAPTEVRLNRFIANAGICSRREADDLIKAGEIRVNGSVVTEMGYQVKLGDIVKFGNRKLSREKLVYVLLNKPKDFITTTEDPNERKTVMDLVANACQERIYPVGRLDRNTTGLLLLTNDGELADKLTHPSNQVEKLYQVELDKPLEEVHFDQILKGLKLEDGEIKADELAIVTPDAMVVGVKIHSGRNRIVRRIFESLGYEVMKLDRTVFAGLNKKDLPRGTWRFLNEKEVVNLKFR